jgi:predicted membrane-bound spermidine synthase
MSLTTSKDWNQFLIRFIVAFAFWEVLAFPLRMLFFSKFYHDPSIQSMFIRIADVYWLGPIAADFLGIFALGFLYAFVKNGLPEGLVGGILFGFAFSIAAFVAPVLFVTSLTIIAPTALWWIWVLFLSMQTLVVSSVYSVSLSEKG